MAKSASERGQPASIDRGTGAVHGSGAGAGGGNPGEDYDDDPAAGGGEKPQTGSKLREDSQQGTSG